MSITEFLADDHGRIVARFEELRNSLDAGKQASQAALEEFKTALKQHSRYVQGMVVPIVKDRLDESTLARVKEFMVDGHDTVNSLVRELEENLSEGGSKADVIQDRLLAAMNEHFSKEEKVLYPIFDQNLTDTEKEKLVERMEDEHIQPAKDN